MVQHQKRALALLSAILLLLSSVFGGCARAVQETEADMAAVVTENAAADEEADALLGMTLRQKVGQLFVIRIESLDTQLSAEQVHATRENGVTQFTDEMAQMFAEYPAGGVALFGKNIVDAAQLSQLTHDLQSAQEIPLLLCVDEEGGLVARLANADGFELPKHPDASEVASQGEEAVRKEGETIGTYLHEYGFNMDFAPVADVNSNPDNPIIGTRSFSSEPQEVSQMVTAFLDGLHSAGVMGCIKHFPGHGDTGSDTHTGAVVLDKSWEELLSCELIPFIETMDDADMIMTAHISLPKVTGSDLPATMSSVILTEKLRGELGYDGVIITDSLAMGAVTDSYTSAQAAVDVFFAGADILLMPWDYTEAFDAVLAAVEDGTISQERLDESVLRIMALKQDML